MVFQIGVVLLSILALCQAACTGDYDKYNNIPGHSACVSASPNAANTGVSSADKTLIVDAHNKARREVSPAATNMLKMSWDEDLEFIAQAWASSCNMYHDANDKRTAIGKFGAGQNLAYNYQTWTAAISGWENEKLDFTYGVSTTKKVKHYTQMVWAESYKIGCGYAECGTSKYYVCNYGPAGNNKATVFTPWNSGSSCGDCNSKCENKLCACPNACYNDGSYNLGTCGCTCVGSFYGGSLSFYKSPDCALECNNIQEPAYCGEGNFFDEASCSVYSNAKTHCPVTCSICA